MLGGKALIGGGLAIAFIGEGVFKSHFISNIIGNPMNIVIPLENNLVGLSVGIGIVMAILGGISYLMGNK